MLVCERWFEVDSDQALALIHNLLRAKPTLSRAAGVRWSALTASFARCSRATPIGTKRSIAGDGASLPRMKATLGLKAHCLRLLAASVITSQG